jgi:carboxymethylenebutenolidase
MVDIQTQAIQIPNGELRIDAHLAYPAAPGAYPGIVVIQEIFGVNRHIRDITERLAASGYVTIAPAIYQRLAPGFEVGYDEAGFTRSRELKNQTQAAELLSDIQCAIATLKQLPQVRQEVGLGAIGFCFGGHVV